MTTCLQQGVPRAFIIFLAKSDKAHVIAINTVNIKLDFRQHWQKLSSLSFYTNCNLYFIVVSETSL